MRPYRYHLFICQGKRCSARGSEALLEAFKDAVAARGIEDVLVSRSGCVKVCKETENEGEYSPAVIVYPEGVWYRNVTTGDVVEIIESHLQGGRPLPRLLHFKLGEGAGR